MRRRIKTRGVMVRLLGGRSDDCDEDDVYNSTAQHSIDRNSHGGE